LTKSHCQIPPQGSHPGKISLLSLSCVEASFL
jgi:hypothetical protein